MVVTAGRELVGPPAGYVALGLVGTGLIAGLLPYGCLGTMMRHDNRLAPP